MIPVARAKWAFGGGSGADPQTGGHGGGGGGTGSVRAVGYIEVRRDSVVYRPIRDWRPLAVLGAALLGLIGLTTSRTLQQR